MVQQHPTMHLVKCGYIANEVILPRSLLCKVKSTGSLYTGLAEYLVGQIFGNLGVPFTRGRLTDLTLGHLGVQIFGRLRKRPSLELGWSSSRTAPCEGFGRSNICTVPQRRCKYAIKRPLVNERLFLMSFRSKKVISSLPLYVSHSLMDK